MEGLFSLLLSVSAAVIVVAYFVAVIVYRLLLHPLARFPGPKLAAATRWYEAYYDVIQGGKYEFKIAEMHKKYGYPYEIHIHDPSYYDQLYRQDGRWNKYSFAVDGFSAYTATICTVDHDVHRARRQSLNPFFSKSKVYGKQRIIRENVRKLCYRLAKFADSGETVNIGAAISALTRDVSTTFILGLNYNSLDRKDFDVGMTNVFKGSGGIWRLTKHVPWFGPTMKRIPVEWIMKTADEDMKSFFLYLQKDNGPRTIVHEILDSNLAPSEKSFQRIFEDVSTVTAAGFETVASILRLIVFHVFDNPRMLQQLRVELTSAAANSDDGIDLKTLEQLPYLTAVLKEGMRMSPATASRGARVAPDRDTFYREWRIPAGTPVSMTSIMLHADESQFPEPLRFNPDRWMDSSSGDRFYAPFSKGTRNCLGQHFAWAEMYIATAELVRRFDFQFQGSTAEDFLFHSDQFTIGTKGKGILNARITFASEL
ncbi:trichodiene oxygenase [Thozetella sp. PMI_491]|nr:trichodiene oxygenase [Thozetella sp. PMI_491]